MVEIILLYLTTILVSKAIDTYNILVRMKDLTDAGYKLKNDRIIEDMHKELKVRADYWYIPFYNMYDSLACFYDYISNDKSMLLYQEYKYDRVEELNPREKKKYEENPSMLNAYLLEYKMENIRSKSNSISLSDGSKIFYTMDSEEGIKFVDCIGPSQYRDEKQLTSYLLDGYELIIDEYANNLKEYDLTEEELNLKLEQINEVKIYINTAREKIDNNAKTLVKKI